MAKIIPIIIGLFIAFPAYAAGGLNEDFDGMTTGNVDGQNGWVMDTCGDNFDIVDDNTISSPNSFFLEGVVGCNAFSPLFDDPSTTGDQTFYFYNSVDAGDLARVVFNDESDGMSFAIDFNFNGTDYDNGMDDPENISSTKDAWQKLELSWNESSVTYSIDDGSPITKDRAGGLPIKQLYMYSPGVETDDVWLDSFSTTPPVIPANLDNSGSLTLFHTYCMDFELFGSGSGESAVCSEYATAIEIPAIKAFQTQFASIIISPLVLCIRWAIWMFFVITSAVFLFRIVTFYRPIVPRRRKR
jgi:hypothetical protein